jgi:hypothetical protein
LAKQKREERAMMGDECSEEHTFKPKVNPRPKYLEKGRQNSSDSLDMLTGSTANPNDVFEQPLPGSKPKVDHTAGIGFGFQNPPSPNSDALGNEMKRHPHKPPSQPHLQQHHSYPVEDSQPHSYQQPQLRQNQSYPNNEQTTQSPYKSKFMQQYDEQIRPPESTSASTTNVAEEVDANFFGSLRSGGNSSKGGGWNDDISNGEIPSLGPPKRKVSYRRRKATDNPNSEYPPAPTFSSNRTPHIQHSQSHDPPPWNGETEFDPESVPPSHYGNRSNAKSTPTSMTSNEGDEGFMGNQTAPRQGGDIGHARSRLSLLKTKMRRSDSGNNIVRPNNGEATNLPNTNNPPKQKSAPSQRQRQLQQAESGWNNDFADSSIPDVPQAKPNRRRQPQQQQQQHRQQQHAQAESGWNNDISDTHIPDVPQPTANRRRQPQQQEQQQDFAGGHPPRRQAPKQQPAQSRWNDSSEIECDVGSSSLPGSATGAYREQQQQQQRKPPRQVSAPRAQQHTQQQPQPEPQFQQQQYQEQQLPPDAYPPSGDPFAAGMEHAPVGEQKQCPDCGRKFNPSPYEKHIKICAKVFLEKRKAFDSKKMRIESVAADNPDIVKVLNEKEREERRLKNKGKQAPQSERAIAAAAKKAKWKSDSDAFRAAMRAGKEVSQAIASGGPMPAQTASVPDPSFVPCPNCGRTFNEKAAERHIPNCKNIKAKPSTLKRGSGGAGGKNGQIIKPAMTKLPGSKRR